MSKEKGSKDQKSDDNKETNTFVLRSNWFRETEEGGNWLSCGWRNNS